MPSELSIACAGFGVHLERAEIFSPCRISIFHAIGIPTSISRVIKKANGEFKTGGSINLNTLLSRPILAWQTKFNAKRGNI